MNLNGNLLNGEVSLKIKVTMNWRGRDQAALFDWFDDDGADDRMRNRG
jgi:hypothetical protein